MILEYYFPPGSGHVAVPGTHLLKSRHHGPDARGGEEIHDSRQNMERFDQTGVAGQTRVGSH